MKRCCYLINKHFNKSTKLKELNLPNQKVRQKNGVSLLCKFGKPWICLKRTIATSLSSSLASSSSAWLLSKKSFFHHFSVRLKIWQNNVSVLLIAAEWRNDKSREIFSRRRRRLVSGQVVSCYVDELPKQLRKFSRDNGQTCATIGQSVASTKELHDNITWLYKRIPSFTAAS